MVGEKMRNIVLIGMPGAGKSTIGVVLAKKLGMRFMDSDLVIQNQYDMLLHEIMEEKGLQGFLDIEEEVNAQIDVRNHVIATGGSVIYGAKAMEHLKQIATVVYLKLSYEEINNRLGDLNARGVALKPGQTLEDLYRERTPLYEKYADFTVECDGRQLRENVELIAAKFV